MGKVSKTDCAQAVKKSNAINCSRLTCGILAARQVLQTKFFGRAPVRTDTGEVSFGNRRRYDNQNDRSLPSLSSQYYHGLSSTQNSTYESVCIISLSVILPSFTQKTMKDCCWLWRCYRTWRTIGLLSLGYGSSFLLSELFHLHVTYPFPSQYLTSTIAYHLLRMSQERA